MKLQEDFYNKVMPDIKSTYFPTVNVLASDKEYKSRIYQRYSKVKYQVELFHNGCLVYNQFINKLSTLCKDSENNIHTLISKYVSSFGEYKLNTKYKSILELNEIIEEISFKTFYEEQLEMFCDIYGFIYTQCDNEKDGEDCDGFTTFQIQIEDDGEYIGEFVGNDNDGYIFKNYNEK